MANPPTGPGSPKSNPPVPPRPGAARQSLGGQLKIPGASTPAAQSPASKPAESKPASPASPPASRPGSKSGVNLGQTPLPANRPASGTKPGPVPNRPTLSGSPASTSPAGASSPGNSGRMPAVGRPRSAGNVGADREALGLSSMKPSEMIAGLDAAVRRAEAQEQRESARRKGGGKIDQNVALHVGDAGARSTRMIVIGIVIFVVLMACLFGGLVIYSNYQPLDPHKGNEMARDRLGNLKFICEKMKKFEDDESVTLEKAKARVLETIDARLKVLTDEIDANKKQWEKDKNTRPVNVRVYEEKKDLEQTRDFKDPFGQPFQFQLDGDKLKITAKGKYDSKGGSPPAPITIELRKHKAEDGK